MVLVFNCQLYLSQMFAEETWKEIIVTGKLCSSKSIVYLLLIFIGEGKRVPGTFFSISSYFLIKALITPPSRGNCIFARDK